LYKPSILIPLAPMLPTFPARAIASYKYCKPYSTPLLPTLKYPDVLPSSVPREAKYCVINLSTIGKLTLLFTVLNTPFACADL
jgi:hypothetical protein